MSPAPLRVTPTSAPLDVVTLLPAMDAQLPWGSAMYSRPSDSLTSNTVPSG